MPSWFGIDDTNGQYRQSRARSEFRAIQGCDLDVSAGSHQTSGALVVLADRRHAADEFRAFPGLALLLIFLCISRVGFHTNMQM